MSALKFAGLSKGTKIKAYDFEPIPGRPEAYVEGIIIAEVAEGIPYHAYEIHVTKCTMNQRVGEKVFVPHEMSMLEFDNRVTKLEKPSFAEALAAAGAEYTKEERAMRASLLATGGE